VLFGLLKELEAFLRLLPEYKTEEAGNFRFHRAGFIAQRFIWKMDSATD
jgi:hypothetical protein